MAVRLLANHNDPVPGDSKAGGIRRDALMLLGICGLALVVRLAYFAQIRDVPFFENLIVDARLYDAWAQELAAGDWIGRGVFYQAPLYPYLLGVLYKVFGRDLGLVRVVQLVLGAGSCGLMYLACRLLFSRGAAIAAGLLLALYPPAIFFEGLIQKAGLALLFEVLLLWLLARTQKKPGWFNWGATGLALGLLSMTWENARILVLVVLVWLAIHFAAISWKRRAGWALAVVVGVSAVLLPVGLRNLLVGGEFVLSTSQAGFMFYIGNNPNARGTYQPLVPGRQDNLDREDSETLAEQALGRELSPHEVSRYWFARAWDFIRTQPVAWFGLQCRKFMLAWNRYEISDSVDYYFYQEWSRLLLILDKVLNLGVLCPLAAVGLVLTWSRRRDLWWLYALLATIVASIVIFFIFSRYRFPIVPVLIMFAGVGIVEGFHHVRRRTKTLPILAVAVLVALFSNRPVAEANDMRALAYTNYGAVLHKEGKIAEALEQYERGLALVPDDAQGHYDAGILSMTLKRYDRAIAHFRAAAEVDPGFCEAHNRWGAALGMQGRFAEAVECFSRAIQVRPDHDKSYNDLGYALANLQRLDEAEQAYRRAIALNPTFEQAVANLYQAFLAREKYADAIDLLRDAARNLPRSAMVLDNLAWLLAACPVKTLRDPDEAVRLAERLCALTKRGQPAHLETLAAVYAVVGRFDDARKTLTEAIDLAESAGLAEAVQVLRRQLEMYRAGISPLSSRQEQTEPGPAHPVTPSRSSGD